MLSDNNLCVARLDK